MKLMTFIGLFAAMVAWTLPQSAWTAVPSPEEIAGQNLEVANRFRQSMSEDARFKNIAPEAVRIEVLGNRATIRGTVDTDSQKRAAEELAHAAGANKVNNLLRSYEEINRSAG